MLSYEERRRESTEWTRNSIMAHRAQMIHPDVVLDASKGAENIPVPQPIPQPIPKKEKLRPRSILEDWEVTQDSG
jgi:hypothetical protein